ncbi:MAG: hypothetical protein WBB45_11820 [Cyclobacteriaceae bacterium]
MRKLEIVLAAALVLGFIMKLLHLQGANMTVGIAGSLLAILYFVFTFALVNGIRARNIFKNSSYRHTNIKRIIGAIGLGFALSSIVIGLLFRIMLWSGATYQLLASLIVLAIVTLVAGIFYFRSRVPYYHRIFIRAGIYGVAGLVFFFLSTYTMIGIYYGDDPAYTKLYKEVIDKPSDYGLREELRQTEYRPHTVSDD